MKSYLPLLFLPAILVIGIYSTYHLLAVYKPNEIAHEDMPEWSYQGDLSPEHWAELCSEFRKCAEGQRQSPIDIETVSVRELSEDGLALRYHPSQVDVQNNGHTIEIDLEEADTLDTGGAIYELKQFHFHEPAEHKLDGVLYPMEMHLVHVNEKGRLAVVGVFIKEGPANPELEAVWKDLPDHPNAHVHARQPLDLMQLLPAERSFFHYTGSLTTPPCTEGVQWYVLKEPLTLSKQQIETFKNLYHGNSRPVQDAHKRPIEAN